ncbi:hypothetical protein BTUL_0083g00400 [Botrytis tulipae]|uniref:Uncharacterized protein n=1 Tax=Botrytis tulipae TaxID=87230 RepID=A0A4Z1EV64_9HELO|nr:hypothetical protein BTUL_0083g00400 [Botrytis tulipae]
MSNATIPTGLRVCKESRDETLGFYKLCFAAEPWNARIYFNVDCDVPHLITKPLASSFGNPHNVNRPFTTYSMGPVVVYLALFIKAHAAIKNDIKAVCLEDCRHLALEYEGPRMHLFGPNCQVFDFHGIDFRTQNLDFGEHPQQRSLRQRIVEIFGNSKFAHIDGHPPVYPIGRASAPSSQPSDSFAPLIEQVWAADCHGFNDIVWQFIEQKVNTTSEEERQSSSLEGSPASLDLASLYSRIT